MSIDILLATAIGFAWEAVATLLGIFSSRRDTLVASERVTAEIRATKRAVISRVSSEKYVNASFVEKVVSQAIGHFEALLKLQPNQIDQIIAKHRLDDLVRELQANAAAIKCVISFTPESEEDRNVIATMVAQGLMPLHAALAKTELYLSEGAPQMWLYCKIVGTTALLSGYAFLGVDRQELREPLEKEITQIRNKLLDQVALRILSEGKPFPWDKVPRILAYESMSEIRPLLDKSTKFQETRGQGPDQVKTLVASTSSNDLVRHIKTGETELVAAIFEYESQNRKRTRILAAAKKRLAETSSVGKRRSA